MLRSLDDFLPLFLGIGLDENVLAGLGIPASAKRE